MFNLGFQEILVILLVALIFLGPKMLPDIASGLGKAIREVRKAANEVKNQIELDDVIRKPLQELREATLLPPEELKRRDEEKAAQAKRDEESRKQAEAPAAEAKVEAPAEAPKANAPLRDATLVMNPPPDHNRPPFTPHPEALKPVAESLKPVVAAPTPGEPAARSLEMASDATVMDMAPVRITTPTPTVVASMPEAQPAAATEAAPAPRISASLPVVGLPPPSAARRPGVKVPPPLPLPPSFKKD